MWEACSDIQVLDNIDKAHKFREKTRSIPWKQNKFSLEIIENNVSVNYNLKSRINQQKA